MNRVGGSVRQDGEVPAQAEVVGLHGRPGPAALGAQFPLEARRYRR